MTSSSNHTEHMFSLEEWEEKMKNVHVSKSLTNSLVLDYLVLEGYKEAAVKFSEEVGIEPSVDLETISDRNDIRYCIQRGEIQEAIELINDLNPEILDSNPVLYFHLQQQKVIELIRQDQYMLALSVAQEEVAPLVEDNPEFLGDAGKMMALFALEKGNLEGSSLLGRTHRQRVAAEVNSCILGFQGRNTEAKIPIIVKMMLWSQSQLKKKANFPVMNVSSSTSAKLVMNSKT